MEIPPGQNGDEWMGEWENAQDLGVWHETGTCYKTEEKTTATTVGQLCNEVGEEKWEQLLRFRGGVVECNRELRTLQ